MTTFEKYISLLDQLGENRRKPEWTRQQDEAALAELGWLFGQLDPDQQEQAKAEIGRASPDQKV